MPACTRYLLILLAIVLVVILCDALYACFIAYREKRWEQTLQRTGEGLLPLAEPFTCGQGETAILLVHGFADTPRTFYTWAQHITATNDSFTCHAMRLPGMADNGKPSLDMWLNAIEHEVKELRKDHDTVWIAAHSLGAALSLLVVEKNPELVDGMVLFAPLISVSGKRSFLLAPDTLYKLLSPVLCFTKKLESPFSADRIGYTADRFIPLETYKALFTATDHLIASPHRPLLPLFAAVPQRDSIVDSPTSLLWLKDWQAPHVIIQPDMSHLVLTDPGWEDIADQAAAFITAQSKQ